MSALSDDREFENDNERWTTTPPPTREAKLHPLHVTDTVPRDYKTIPGWGVDLDPRNRPMVPMELPSDVMTARGEVRYWQVPHDKVHMSVEHPNRTPVFGVASPPRGLSGAMRDYAYRYSEGTNRHWMTLTLADRVDVLESLITGLLTGKPDRYIHEKGWSAGAKYGPGSTRINYVTLGAALVGALALGAIVKGALRDD